MTTNGMARASSSDAGPTKVPCPRRVPSGGILAWVLKLRAPNLRGKAVEEATVLIQDTKVITGEVDVVAELQAIPRARIERMQATLAQQAHRMHYSAIDTAQLPVALGGARTDAFDLALEGAWRRSARYPGYKG